MPAFVVGWDVRLGSENVTSVLVIDDHPIVLQACRRLLEDAGVASVLEAGDVAAGYELFCRDNPDVVIVDLAMEKNSLGGLSLIQRINSHDPQAHILVLSMHRDPIIVARAPGSRRQRLHSQRHCNRRFVERYPNNSGRQFVFEPRPRFCRH